MSKPEVCRYLGKSKRTVETYIASGRLACAYYQGPNGKTAIFKRSDVEALKREIETPTMRAVVPGNVQNSQNGQSSHSGDTALAPPWKELADFTRLIVTMRDSRPEPVRKPWLSLAEAAEYSGLPAAYLLAQARADKARAINVGNRRRAEDWFFHRASLAK